MFRKTTVAMVFTLLLACGPALAASTVDQEQTNAGTGVGVDARFPAAQGFTAGRTGVLDGVAVNVQLLGSHDAGDLLIEVRAADANGLPSGAALGGGSVPVSSFTAGAQPTWRDVSLAQPVAVTQGARYVMVVSSQNSPGGAFYNWRASFDDPYPGGNALWRPGTSTQWETRTDNGVPMDYAFKTFVADVGAPTVGSTNPTAKERGVPRDAVVEATFSEAMNSETVTPRTVILRDMSTGRRVPAVVSCNDPCTQVTLDPFGDEAGRLGKSTKYRATISTGATDVAGNALDAEPDLTGSQSKTWTFTTGRSTMGPR